MLPACRKRKRKGQNRTGKGRSDKEINDCERSCRCQNMVEVSLDGMDGHPKLLDFILLPFCFPGRITPPPRKGCQLKRR